jgi:ferredoxin
VDVCANVQTVHNLAASGRGSEVKIGPAFSKPMAESLCIGCGRCVEVCPTGAIFAKERKDEILEYTHTYEMKTVAMADAALIPEIERIWPREHKPITIEQIAGGMKKLGFTTVVSAQDAKDAARAEAEELLDKRLKKGSAILADTLAAKKLLERDYADYADRFVFAPSAASVFGAYAKETLSADKTAVFGPVGPEAGEVY